MYFKQNLSCLRYRNKGCSFTLTLGFSEIVAKFIEVHERQHGKRTRFIMNFKNAAYSAPELRDVGNFWVESGTMDHWSGCVLDLDNSVVIDLYSKLEKS